MKSGDIFWITHYGENSYYRQDTCCKGTFARSVELSEGDVLMFIGYKPCTCPIMLKVKKVALFLTEFGVIAEHCTLRGKIIWSMWNNSICKGFKDETR
jgi:hypothetical protein